MYNKNVLVKVFFIFGDNEENRLILNILENYENFSVSFSVNADQFHFLANFPIKTKMVFLSSFGPWWLND